MKLAKLGTSLLVLCLTLVSMPLVGAHSAGGGIQGKVTDPKGAVVVGAAVTVTDPVTNQTFTAVTDQQGKFKVEGLAAGVYSVTVSAQGFDEGRRGQVKVTDGAVATADIKLEIAPVEAALTVKSAGPPPNSDPIYQELRQMGRGPANSQATSTNTGNTSTTTGNREALPKNQGVVFANYATVNNLVLKRDAATFTLRSGEIYFTPMVQNRTVGAVFFGDGEITLTPPTEAEKHSLTLFTNKPTLAEAFDKLVLRFSDRTYEEIKSSAQAQMGTNGPQAVRARDNYRENQTLLRKTLRRNLELRTLVDLFNPNRPGFFTAFINGKKYNKLIFQYDPLGIPDVSPEEVLLSSYGETDGGLWTAFHREEEYAKGTASSDEDHRIYDITHHEIDGGIKGTKFAANDTVTIRGLDAGARVLPFSLFPSLRVARVRDEAGKDLTFVQENKDEDADFGVILPAPLEAGKTIKLTFEYAGGDALINVGGGNYFVNPSARLTWYPNNEGSNFGDRATFNVTFRYPKGKTLIGTGASTAPDTADGNVMVGKWSGGQTALAVAGFNYGSFRKKELTDPTTGYKIEFYSNEALPSFMEDAAEDASMSTSGMANSMLADTQNATRLFNLYFGKLPFTRIALTQQPDGGFGQAWPTLIYMPFTAFMDPTQRYLGTGGNIRYATNDFFEYVAPHEIAHQWWGHMVGWKSYRDQWMSEGFAEFSVSLYIQHVLNDQKKFLDFWSDQRERITKARPQTNDIKPYTVGPVTQGYRLISGRTRAAYQFLVYPKGAYILHMLRQMMFDPRKEGDKKFQAMMQDFIKSHYNEDVSTEDFKRIVEKHMTKAMDLDENGRMDWFFNEWVYGTEIPSYKFEYQITGDVLNGRITQSGVSPNFRMLVPLYLDQGKGWGRVGAATLVGSSSVELTNVKIPPGVRRASICALNDVLALSIDNAKR